MAPASRTPLQCIIRRSASNDRSTAPHEALWPDHRDPGRVVQRRAGRDRGLPRPERGGEVDDDAHPRLLHARLERDGAGRGTRRVPRVAGGPQADRLPPGERPALRGPPRRAVPGLRRRGQGRGARRASAPGRGGHGALPHHRRPAPAHRPAVEGLPAAGRTRAGDPRARLPAAVEPARAQAGGGDARGGLHSRGGRRATRRGVELVRIWPIFKKEMRLYFTSPVAYVVVAIFALIAGYFFYSIFAFFTLASMQSMMNPAMARELNVTDSVMRPLFSNISVILLLLMPLVTMRQFAEERRSGTIELLLTYPVRDGAVLAAKYLAALALYGLMLVLTLLYPGIVVAFARLEWGPVATGYVGLLLMGSTFIAVGLFASSLTENQIVASITTFGILLILWIIGWSADYAGGAWGKVLQHLSILEHNDNFAKGVLDTKDVLYYANFIALALFLTLRSLEARRWKG